MHSLVKYFVAFPSVWVCLMFFHGWVKLYIFGSYHRNDVLSSLYIVWRGGQWYWCFSLLVMATALVTWFRWCLLGFLPVNNWLSLCSQYRSWSRFFETIHNLLHCKLSPIHLVSISWFCLQQLLLWYLPNDGFLFFFFPSTCIGIVLWGRAAPSPCIYLFDLYQCGLINIYFMG